MDYQRYVTICYPKYRTAARVIEQLSLKDRSLLIKACQAQHIPLDPTTTLHRLLKDEVTYLLPRRQSNVYRTVPLYEIFPDIGVSPDEPCQAAILLDLLRSAPASSEDFRSFKDNGWIKEIDLSHTSNKASVQFDYFFSLNPHPGPHPLIPDNPIARAKIVKVFATFRRHFQQYKPTLFARYTHKNMSFDTRRHFERATGQLLQDVPIWGQDDWIRYYHETGVQLEGSIEMRQKWYPSGAKPRTYFAQGGTAYHYSRFLQDFFTMLVNAFPSTNHITRLEPYRLRVPTDQDGHYLVYDLTSFTSNMQEMRPFCDSLARFFEGVEVEVFDEYFGRISLDLGDMLHDYNEHCSHHPMLNQDRVPTHLKTTVEVYEHERASMLGVYGNLMLCTVAHFLIVAPTCEDPFQENNTAGDDGLALLFLVTYFSLLMAISLVGTFSIEKTFRSEEDGCICLKRPLSEVDDPLMGRSLRLGINIVPPTLATSVSYLEGYNVDPRYHIFYGDAPSLPDAISIVGKDLLRFLTSAFESNYDTPLVHDVFYGFQNLVTRVTGVQPVTGGVVDGRQYVWPVRPDSYCFLVHDPFYVYATYVSKEAEFFDKREVEEYDGSLKEVGDSTECNSSPWLTLMETLGYIEKEDLQVLLTGKGVRDYLYTILRQNRVLAPVVRKYTVIKDIPVHMF